jgi:hypothetical protein
MRESPKMIRRGRPAGAVTRVVIDTLASEPLSRRQLAARLSLSYGHADDVIVRLQRRGVVAEVGCEWPRPSSGRAGSLYAPAPAEQRTADLQAVWLRVIST